MRTEWKDLGRKWQFPVTLAAIALPPTMMCCQGSIDVNNGCIPQALLLIGIYLVLAMGLMVVRGKLRLPFGMGGAALLAVLAYALLPWREVPLSPIPAALLIGLLLWGLRMGGWQSDEELHIGFHIVGIACYLAYYALLNTSVREDTGPQNQLLLAGFLVMMLMSLLAMNRYSVSSAASRGKAPQMLRRRNTLLTIGLMAVVTLISAIPVLSRWAYAAWDWFLIQFMRIAAWVISLFPSTGTTGSSTGMGSMDLGGLAAEEEPSLLAVILEKVTLVLAGLLLIVLSFFVLRVLYRKLKRLIHTLMELLARYAAASTEDYVDEIESTREDEEHERTVSRRSQVRRLRRVNEAKLTPNERIRYRYLMLLLHHPDWSDAATARETLPASAATIYERARYSDAALPAEEAEQFAQDIAEKI